MSRPTINREGRCPDKKNCPAAFERAPGERTSTCLISHSQQAFAIGFAERCCARPARPRVMCIRSIKV